MFAAREQENLAFAHQHGGTLKKQQSQTSRHLAPKPTPGKRHQPTPMKIPLNDENGAQAMTSKAIKGSAKGGWVTPGARSSRAVLGDKTTNAKAKGLQSVNVNKSTVKEVEKSQAKLQTTVRQRQKNPQAETQKLQVHAEESDPLGEDDVEYCPPRPKDLPYESDVFPDGVLTFDALKPENMLKGYYQYYFNPIDQTGKSERDRKLEEEARKAVEEGERDIKNDLDAFEREAMNALVPDSNPLKKVPASIKPASTASSAKQPTVRRPLSTVRSRTAANILVMDDTTKSLQRKAVKASEPRKPLNKKPSSFGIPGLRTSRPALSQTSSIPRKSPVGLEANSRTTIGYNKGRATASLLNKGRDIHSLTKEPSTLRSTSAASTVRTRLARSNTTMSSNSDRTITPSLYAHKQASAAANATDDEVWRERVPFLSIFNPSDCNDDDDDDDCPLRINDKVPSFLDDDEEEEFELKLAD